MQPFHCISLNQARKLIMDSLTGDSFETETVSLLDSLGRVAAQDVLAAEDLPPFSRSAVDGFAVISLDTFGASEAAPALFTLNGKIVMGKKADAPLSLGQTAAIPTGGMLPHGADAVVMLEYAECPDEETVLVSRPVAPGENVIAKGEDLQKGQLLINAGKLITSADVGVLAAFGVACLKVRSKLKIGIMSTGDEIVDITDVPEPGQIRDINSYALAAMFKEMGCESICYGIIKDCYHDLKETLKKAANESSIVVISGGSSVGVKDYTVKVIEELGGQKVLFHGLAIKPGKPTMMGLVGNTLVFGLPGHPAAAMIVCDRLVRQAVDLFSGRVQNEPFFIPAKLTRSIASAPGREDFLRVRLNLKNGEYWAEPILGKSGLISTMSQADGIVRILTDTGGLNAGETVKVELV